MLRILVTSLCEELMNEVDQNYIFDMLFQKFPYADMEKDFVDIIRAKAYNLNINDVVQNCGKLQINYFKLLHSYFIFRGDFRNGK